jgi:hypothetical protein
MCVCKLQLVVFYFYFVASHKVQSVFVSTSFSSSHKLVISFQVLLNTQVFYAAGVSA